jgi:membrane-associated phospholipid phosphatase
MWAFLACVVVTRVLAPVEYRRLRRAFFLSMLLALPWYAIYPLAPPRFMTDEYGFIDTLAVYGPSYFSNSGLVKANQYAAMPSMHVGWTIIGGVMLAAAIPKWRIGATLGAIHIALINVAVVVTGNHYVLDAVGGFLIVSAAFAIARLLPAELPWPWRRSAPAVVQPGPMPVVSRARVARQVPGNDTA